MSLTIRPGSPQDARAISELMTRVARDTIAPDLPEAGRRKLAESMTPEAVGTYFEQGFRFHVAPDGERLVGVSATRDDRHLFSLYVDADRRGRGLGTRLWHAARDACVAAADVEGLSVNASLRSVPIYLGWGFVAERPPCTSDGVTCVPMYWRRVPVGDPARAGATRGCAVRIDRVPLRVAAQGLAGPWRPEIVGQVDDHQLKIARLEGEFVRHVHDDADEAFLVLDGNLTMRFDSGDVRLEPGDLLVVPRGVPHRPIGDRCVAVLFEAQGTVNTGDAGGGADRRPTMSGRAWLAPMCEIEIVAWSNRDAGHSKSLETGVPR